MKQFILKKTIQLQIDWQNQKYESMDMNALPCYTMYIAISRFRLAIQINFYKSSLITHQQICSFDKILNKWNQFDGNYYNKLSLKITIHYSHDFWLNIAWNRHTNLTYFHEKWYTCSSSLFRFYSCKSESHHLISPRLFLVELDFS